MKSPVTKGVRTSTTRVRSRSSWLTMPTLDAAGPRIQAVVTPGSHFMLSEEGMRIRMSLDAVMEAVSPSETVSGTIRAGGCPVTKA